MSPGGAGKQKPAGSEETHTSVLGRMRALELWAEYLGRRSCAEKGARTVQRYPFESLPECHSAHVV